MLCATMTGKVGRKPVPPLSGVCSWASVIRARQGVGSKNLLLLFVSVPYSVLYCPYGSAFPLGVMLGLVLSKRFSR